MCDAASPKHSFRLCAPLDAVSGDPLEAAALLGELGSRHCEVRIVDGAWYAELSRPRRQDIGQLLEERELAVALLDSAVGNTLLAGDTGADLDRLRRALEAAAEVGARYVRVYSFLVPSRSTEAPRSEVVARFAEMAEMAGQTQLTLLVENLPGSYWLLQQICERT